MADTKVIYECWDEYYGPWFKCVSCKNNMITTAAKFCPGCGKEIKWKEGQKEITRAFITCASCGGISIANGQTFKCSNCGEVSGQS